VPRASRSGSGVTGSAYAIVATPQPIEQPIPAEWRAPLARFLHELGAPDVESILDSTKGGPTGGVFSEARWCASTIGTFARKIYA
jgi:hypothetical protein